MEFNTCNASRWSGGPKCWWNSMPSSDEKRKRKYFLFKRKTRLRRGVTSLFKLICSNAIFPFLEKERFMPESHMSSYQTLVGCKPFHPRRVECFQETEVCLSCSTHTSAPGFDEAFASHATDLDQTYNTISKTCRSRKFSIMTISYI